LRAIQTVKLLDGTEVRVRTIFNLTEEYPLSDQADVSSLVSKSGQFFEVIAFLRLLDEGKIEREHLEREIRAQIQWCFDQGLSPTHVAGNWVAHVHPAVAHALIPAMERYGLHRVRIPCEEPLPPEGRSLGVEVPEAQLAEIREIKKLLDGQLREGTELEVAVREIALQIENLRRNIQEKYGADLAQLLPDFRPLEEERLTELVNRLEKERQAVENFGEVNLLALSEHEELKTRFDFLTGQIADLNASLDTLQKTITRINTVSRQRFAETFAGVNQCFQQVFSRLFPGGRAVLSLTDENDLLETGVDIEIRIPGKRTQSVTLLSGGEKSLSAIALIFSILLYRPVPFVLLDEVDAALDDTNIALFNRLVKETADQSQILMITHNKKSMEIADSLYGVTLLKQGVSTLVSVSLN